MLMMGLDMVGDGDEIKIVEISFIHAGYGPHGGVAEVGMQMKITFQGLVSGDIGDTRTVRYGGRQREGDGEAGNDKKNFFHNF